MSSARIGVKGIKSIQKARAKAAHIFREDGVAPGGGTPNIIPFKKPETGAFTHTNMMDQTQKRKLQKDKQTYLTRAKKYREQDKPKLAIKQEEKIKLIEQQLAKKEHTNSKKYVQFVELELVITEYKPNEKSGDAFSQVIPIFLKEFFKDDIELVAGAVHLDQSSLHGHVLIKPLKMWSELIDRIANPKYYQHLDSIRAKYSDLKRSDRSKNAKEQRIQRNTERKSIYREIPDPVYVLTQAWWNFMNARMKNSLNPIVRGGAREYVDLPTYKKMSKNLDYKKIALDNREELLAKKETTVTHLLNELSSLRKKIISIDGLKNELLISENELSTLSKEKSDIQNKRIEMSKELDIERQELEKIKEMFERSSNSEKDADDLINEPKII